MVCRRTLLAVLAWAGASGSAAGQQMGEERQVGILVLRREPPPASILQKGGDAKQAEKLTAVVLDRSDVREIRQYRDFLDGKVAREPSRLRQADLVNDYVNRRVRAVSDYTLYLGKDVWAPPINTLLVGGDCEDLALLKRWGLNRVGVPLQDSYLVAGLSFIRGAPVSHALLVVKLPEGGVAVLDNLHGPVLRSLREARLEPTYAVNEYGFWKVLNPKGPDDSYWHRAFVAANGAK